MKLLNKIIGVSNYAVKFGLVVLAFVKAFEVLAIELEKIYPKENTLKNE